MNGFKEKFISFLDGVMARIEKKGNLDFQPCILNKKPAQFYYQKNII